VNADWYKQPFISIPLALPDARILQTELISDGGFILIIGN
jgi:hypothetical protein